MNKIEIREIRSRSELLEAYPMISQLRTHLTESAYLELVREAQEKEGYKMFALVDRSDIVAVIGFQPMITLYYGRFIWVCDLVTDVNRRSEGLGEKLLSFVHEWAKDHEYESIALSSGLQRTKAHDFYENRMDYDKVSYVFKRSL